MSKEANEPKKELSARELIARTARDPNMTIEAAAVAVMRISLQKYLEEPEDVNLSDLGDVLMGAGSILKGTAVESNDEGSLLSMVGFVRGDAPEEG